MVNLFLFLLYHLWKTETAVNIILHLYKNVPILISSLNSLLSSKRFHCVQYTCCDCWQPCHRIVLQRIAYCITPEHEHHLVAEGNIRQFKVSWVFCFLFFAKKWLLFFPIFLQTWPTFSVFFFSSHSSGTGWPSDVSSKNLSATVAIPKTWWAFFIFLNPVVSLLLLSKAFFEVGGQALDINLVRKSFHVMRYMY